MTPDVLVVGAGVFGLSVAFAAHRAGLRVHVVDADHPGAGSSGGIVGALTPHAPTRWRPMMAFQFAALQSLETRCAELTGKTGIDTGYGRVGRLVPLVTDRALERAKADIAAAPTVWPSGEMRVVSAAPTGAAHDLAQHGWLHDTVSGRVAPRKYLDALVASIPPGTISVADVRALVPGARIETAKGRLSAGAVVVSAGWQGWSLLPPPLRGSGVKGQAALLALELPDVPVITHDGLYIIPHTDGTVAVGSTSEKRWITDGPDTALDDIIGRAAEVLPALATAPVLERWAGVRPKPPGREPLAGPVPGLPSTWVAGGGFRIGFGIAHAIGDAVVAMITGQAPSLPVPDTFLPATHFNGPAPNAATFAETAQAKLPEPDG